MAQRRSTRHTDPLPTSSIHVFGLAPPTDVLYCWCCHSLLKRNYFQGHKCNFTVDFDPSSDSDEPEEDVEEPFVAVPAVVIQDAVELSAEEIARRNLAENIKDWFDPTYLSKELWPEKKYRRFVTGIPMPTFLKVCESPSLPGELGVIATRDIKRRTSLGRYQGRIFIIDHTQPIKHKSYIAEVTNIPDYPWMGPRYISGRCWPEPHPLHENYGNFTARINRAPKESLRNNCRISNVGFVSTTRNIKKGEELFAPYGRTYRMPKPGEPPEDSDSDASDHYNDEEGEPSDLARRQP